MYNTDDVMKMQRIAGAGQLLNSMNKVSEEREFLRVLRKESMEEDEGEGILKLLSGFEAGMDMQKPLYDDESIKEKKREEEEALCEYKAQLRRKRRLVEEMLIERRLAELERIATGDGKYGNMKYGRLKGVSAAELLSGLI